MTAAEEIFAIFRDRGAGAYFGESVSMSEHALQAAHFAQTQAAAPALIVAALLHDIGHLIDDVPDGHRGLDQRTPATSLSAAAGSHGAFRRQCSSRFACTCPPSAICARPTGGISPD